MSIERTLCMVKPDAVGRRAAGAILAAIEEAGLRVVAARTLRLTRTQAEAFYAVHRARPFFAALVEFTGNRPDFFLHEVTHGLAKQFLFFGE